MKRAALIALATVALAAPDWGRKVDIAYQRAAEECARACQSGDYTILVALFRRHGGTDEYEYEDSRAALQRAKSPAPEHCGVWFILRPRGHRSISAGFNDCREGK